MIRKRDDKMNDSREQESKILEDLFRVHELDEVLDAVVKLARSILRDKDAKELLGNLDSDERQEFWRAFFQVVLSRPLGVITPDIKWEYAETLDSIRGKKLKSTGLEDKIRSYRETYGQDVFPEYTVAQFWDANGLRTPSFVVCGSTELLQNAGDIKVKLSDFRDRNNYAKQSNLWSYRWALMSEIGKRARDPKDQSVNNDLPPVSIGNFIVRRSELMDDTCEIFRLHVGPDDVFDKATGNTKVEDYIYLEMPRSIVRLLLSNLEPSGHTMKLLDELGAIENAEDEDRPTRVKRAAELVEHAVAKIVEQHSLEKKAILSKYIDYVCHFLAKKYAVYLHDKGLMEMSVEQVVKLLINNLIIARSILEDGDKIDHYQYCMPTWHRNTSYLFLTTRHPLGEKELHCFQKFAERLFGLAWANDSDRKIEEDQENAGRAARAAVLARNFSHTMGSHVICNPDFAKDLLGRVGRRPLTDILYKFTQKYKSGGRRIDFWEEGRPFINEVHKDLRDGLAEAKAFLRFLQGRFDFIARAIDDDPDPLDTMFFKEDLLNGFFSQTAFLDNLVNDLGWDICGLRFKILTPGPDISRAGSPDVTTIGWDLMPQDRARVEGYNVDDPPYIKTEAPTVGGNSVLVGLPGGSIGAHAFYSLLENIIRNSFKYGTDANRTDSVGQSRFYTLNIYLKRTDIEWELYFWDNFSKVGDIEAKGSPFQIVSKSLNRSIIDPKTSAVVQAGLGIQEMKLCARSLSMYRSKKREAGRVNDLRLLKPDEIQEACPPAYRDTGASSQPIVYSINLARPILIAVYAGPVKWAKSPGETIRQFTSLHELAQSGAHIGLLLGDMIESTEARLRPEDVFGKNPPDIKMRTPLEALERLHASLPYRLLVVCRDEAQLKRCEGVIEQNEKIPPRRLHCCCGKMSSDESTLYEFATKGTLRDQSDHACHTEQAEQDAVCRLYETWLRAWKGEPPGGKWHLWIGFERNPGIIIDSAWGRFLHQVGVAKEDNNRTGPAYKSDLISVLVRCQAEEKEATLTSDLENDELMKAAGGDAEIYWQTELDAPLHLKRALVFDNHGKNFGEAVAAERQYDYRASTRFYQHTGESTLNLFQRLYSPPSSHFAFQLFMFQLVESCLCVIAVADERVAADTLLSSGETEKFDYLLGKHQRAGVFPMFLFGNVMDEGATRTREDVQSYSTRYKDRLLEHCPGALNEGLTFPVDGSDGPALNFLIPRTNNVFELLPAAGARQRSSAPGHDSGAGDYIEPDFLIVHEGALDILASVETPRVKWTKQDTRGVYTIVPAVVRTSGRGRHSPNVGAWVPFLEASMLSSALVTSRNKYDLTRALLGAMGRAIPPEALSRGLS